MLTNNERAAFKRRIIIGTIIQTFCILPHSVSYPSPILELFKNILLSWLELNKLIDHIFKGLQHSAQSKYVLSI